jgi:hypothetical protein
MKMVDSAGDYPSGLPQARAIFCDDGSRISFTTARAAHTRMSMTVRFGRGREDDRISAAEKQNSLPFSSLSALCFVLRIIATTC